jgi:hypothetical protein
VSARYINDSTFEIHVKADENLHFLDVNVLSGTYNKLIKNNGQYIQTRVVLSGDHTGTDQFKIYAEKLDSSLGGFLGLERSALQIPAPLPVKSL